MLAVNIESGIAYKIEKRRIEDEHKIQFRFW